MRRRVRIVWGGVLAALVIAPSASATATGEVTVPADAPWTDTAVDLVAGQRLRIDAAGSAQVLRLRLQEFLFGFHFDQRVGPEGTYVWPRQYPERTRSTTFPLPAGLDGPHPAFCLIGRIGQDGLPFYVGAQYEGTAERSGRLWLGLNDFDVRDNHGTFHARIVLNPPPPPAAEPPPVVSPTAAGQPLPGARVMLLYVDGLRPDVMREMAGRGFLPNLKRVFLDEGLECARAFTTFPSNTLVANGALFTGLLPDRTGIKSQNQFERTTLKPRGPLSEWMPEWLLTRSRSAPRASDLLDKFAPENTYRSLRQRGVMTLDAYIGKGYQFTILPIAPMNPPTLWLHRALNTIRNPFAAAVSVPHHLDEINARYVTEELLADPDVRVIAAWFPMVDKVSHHAARGQFGAARRDIAVFDRLFGAILKRLHQSKLDGSTYFILVSDHGHSGGEQRPNRRANLAEELFYERLGCNVRVVGQRWLVPGSDPTRFVFLDHQAWGQAAIFLPKGAYHGGAWAKNSLGELMRYQVGPNRGRVNLLETVTAFRGREWEPGTAAPVDLVLVKLDDGRVLVYRSEDEQALIEITQANGVEAYRYTPMCRIRQTDAGSVAFESARRDVDPLRYLRDPAFRSALGSAAPDAWIAHAHSAEEWLRASAETDYPDAVVGMAKFFAWRAPMEDLAASRDPDLVVTASRGWSFRSDGAFGTDHGSPLREAMRISWFMAGPRIRHGVLLEPHRIVDIMPTILEMAGAHYDPDRLDGRAVTGIYEER